MRISRKLSDEHKQKISEALKGHRNPNFGKKLSSTHKNRISQSLIKYWANWG